VAIQTKTVVEFDDGRCVWAFDYDDVNLRLTRARCTNGSAQPTKGTVTVVSNGRTFSQVVAAGGSLDQAIPTGAAARLAITVDARGRVDGIDWHFEWGPGVS